MTLGRRVGRPFRAGKRNCPKDLRHHQGVAQLSSRVHYFVHYVWDGALFAPICVSINSRYKIGCRIIGARKLVVVPEPGRVVANWPRVTGALFRVK